MVLQQTVNHYKLVDKIERVDGFLNLGDMFQELWQKHSFDTQDEIFLFIGEEAGFTNSRVIFLWLKSWQMFYPENHFYITKLDDFVNLNSQIEIQEIIDKSRKDNSQNLEYGQEPRIG